MLRKIRAIIEVIGEFSEKENTQKGKAIIIAST
jgi:hypothetical protein